MVDLIPSVDPDLNPQSNNDREKLEFELLELETAIQKLNKREVGQRYFIKWIAVISGILITCCMFLMMWHLVHAAFWGPFAFASSAFTVAMVVAPIFSVTTITVALFVGAFGRFKEKDMENLGKVGIPGLDKLGGG